MAKVVAGWLDLKLKEYDDGSFEGYEALGDTRCEGDWETVRQWIERQLADVEEAIEETIWRSIPKLSQLLKTCREAQHEVAE